MIDRAALESASDAWAETLPTVGGSFPGWYDGMGYQPGRTLGRYIESHHMRLLARCSNQTGKTMAAAKRLDNAARGLLPTVRDPSLPGLVMIADLDNHYSRVCRKIAQVATWPALDEATKYIDGKGFMRHGKRGMGYRETGCVIEFVSGMGTSMAAEGGTYGFGWLDEVPMQAHFGAFIRGMWAAPVWGSMTPIGRPTKWFRERLEGNTETGQPPEEEWLQFVVRLSLAECPWRTEEDIAGQIASTDPIERAQRISADWEGPTRDRRFTAFTDASIIDALPTDGGPWYASWGIDHGEGAGKEFAVLLLWNSRYVVAVDEYVNPNATKPDADAQGIIAVMGRRDVPMAQIRHWRGDANSAGKGNVGESVNAMLGKALGVRLGWPGPVGIQAPRKGPGSVDTGEQIINVALDARELLVHRRCTKLTAALWHYQATGPADPDKHGIDALRYALVEVLCHSGRPTTKLYAPTQGLQVLDHLPAPGQARY